MSRSRVASWKSCPAMRTSGVTPTGSAAVQICAAASSVIAECSMSTKKASKPQASAIMPISAVRASRVAMHSATSPRARRSCRRLVTGMGKVSKLVIPERWPESILLQRWGYGFRARGSATPE